MNNHSLKTKIAFILSTIMSSFIIILILIIRLNIVNKIETNLVDSIYQEQSQMDTGITYIINSISPIYSSIKSNPQVNLLKEENTDIMAVYSNILDKVIVDKKIFNDIILIKEEKVYSTKYQNLNINNFNKDFIERLNNSDRIIESGDIISIEGVKYILFGKKLIIQDDLNELCLLFLMNINSFLEITDTISKNLGETLLLENNHILIHNDISKLDTYIYDMSVFDFSNRYDKTIINDRDVIVISQTAKTMLKQYDVDWKLVTIIDYSIFSKDLNKLNRNIIFVALISLIIGVTVSIGISKSLVGPIARLSMKMKNYSINKNNKIVSNNDEIVELENSFNDMINRITELIDENSKQAENKRKLELYALQMQINPHFLYNTLDAIAWLAKLKKQPQIERLVMSLAQFFRISLHKGDKFIKVEEEIELIKNYVEIELIRFPDEFDIEYDIDENIKNLETMKLILQPLVENSIKHGISGLDKKGKIIIKGYQDEKFVYFEVIDNGVGFDPSKQQNKTKTMSGYGFKNVDERIKLEYGETSGVTVETKIGQGTRVIIKYLKR